MFAVSHLIPVWSCFLLYPGSPSSSGLCLFLAVNSVSKNASRVPAHVSCLSPLLISYPPFPTNITIASVLNAGF